MSYEIHPKARIGHIHLTVGNLDRAVKFYTELLGFSVTARFGDSAMFYPQVIIIIISDLIPGWRKCNCSASGHTVYTILLFFIQAGRTSKGI